MVPPGKRLWALRELIGLTRKEMAEITGIGLNRYTAVEQQKIRMSVDDLERVLVPFPEFESWLARTGDIDLAALRASQAALVRAAAAHIEAGRIPEGYALEGKIRR